MERKRKTKISLQSFNMSQKLTDHADKNISKDLNNMVCKLKEYVSTCIMHTDMHTYILTKPCEVKLVIDGKNYNCVTFEDYLKTL